MCIRPCEIFRILAILHSLKTKFLKHINNFTTFYGFEFLGSNPFLFKKGTILKKLILIYPKSDVIVIAI